LSRRTPSANKQNLIRIGASPMMELVAKITGTEVLLHDMDSVEVRDRFTGSHTPGDRPG